MPSLDDVINTIELHGEAGWLALYEAQVGRSVSQKERLFDLINLYGKWPMIDAILAAGRKKWNKDDPIPYIAAVAAAKWKETYLSTDERERYRRGLERSKRQSAEKNRELADKLERARSGQNR